MKKQIKKSFSIILSAAMIFTGMNANVTPVEAASVTGVVDVKNYSDLLGVQKELDKFITANNSNLNDATFVINIKDNIKATDHKWVGIDVGRRKSYEGRTELGLKVVVNGNGKTISGLSNEDEKKHDDRSVYYSGLSNCQGSTGVGLFGVLNCSVEVSNLTLSDFDLRTRVSDSKVEDKKDKVNTDWECGAFAGTIYGSLKAKSVTVKNTTIEGVGSTGGFVGTFTCGNNSSDGFNVEKVSISNSKVYGPSHTAGLIGTVSNNNKKVNGVFKNCSSDSKTVVDGSATLAQYLLKNNKIFTSSMPGYVSGSAEGFAGLRIGGLIGRAFYLDIIDCENDGSVIAKADNGTFAGGIIGEASESVNIINSKNTGKIDGISNIGGIVGYVSGDSTVKECTNSGNVSGVRDYVGGIAGSDSKQSSISDVTNTGDVTGRDKVGGVIGTNSATIQDIANSGNVTGVNHVGGDVGYNDGTILNAGNNGGNVTGKENVGGNIGTNSKNGSADTISNTGDVKGEVNVGGNVGDNQGTVLNILNGGDINGKENVGGNVGRNEENAKVNEGINAGTVTGDKNVDNNIGLDEGKSSKLKNLPKDDNGIEIIGPKDDNNPNLTNNLIHLFGMEFWVLPPGSGAIYFSKIENGQVTLIAAPTYGYKFDSWKANKTTPATSTTVTTTFNIKKGATITCNFSKAKSNDILVKGLPENSQTPNPDIVKTPFVDGLTLAVTPAKAGNIKLKSFDKSGISLIEEANKDYKFIEWKIEGKVSFAKGSNKNSTTASFNYKVGEKAKITAVFSKIDGPKAGQKVKDKKYIYKVVKAGSKDGKVLGELQVTGLRKKSVKVIKIAAEVNIGGVNYKVVSVKAKAFKGNKKVTKAYIGKNVKTIGANAFAGMKKLSCVVINSTKLKKIDKNAFAKDKKLRKVVIKSTKITKIGNKAFATKGKKITFKVPKSKKKKYKKLLKNAKSAKFVVK